MNMLVFAPVFVGAVTNDPCHQSYSFLNFPTWYEYLEVGPKGSDPCAIIGPTDSQNKFSFEKAIPRIILALIDILLRLAGLAAVGFVIFGGVRYMTSQGEPEALKAARGTLINAIVGLIISVLAFTIVSFIGSRLWS